VFTYKIELIERGTFESVNATLEMAEYRINEYARLGWELDKLMPIEQNNFTRGAVLVFRITNSPDGQPTPLSK
jgi:hypothetical protein